MPSIADIYVSVFAETSKVAPMVRAAFREVDSDAREAGRRWGREIQEGLGETKVKLDADTSKVRAEIDKAAKDQKATVEVGADTAKASAQIDVAARDRHATIEVDVDRNQLSGITSGIAGSVTSAGAKGATGMGTAMAEAGPGIGAQVGSAIGGPMQAALIAYGVAAIGGIAAAASGLAGLIPAAIGGAGLGIGTLVVGLDGVKDAWDAAGKSAQSSGKDQASQAKAVTSAQRDLKSAVNDEARAQTDVANARKDALRQLQGLNSELRHGALDEAQAQLNLVKDQQELLTGTFSTPVDYQQAQLNVLKDQQDVQDAHQRSIDVQDKANTVRQQGVEGNPAVVAAEDRFAASIDRVTDAQQKLTDAFKPSTEMQAAIDAMAKLSPNAQAFINTLQGMKPAFQEFKFAVQDALFAGLGAQFQQLATTYLPLIERSMVGIAGAFNQMFSGLTDQLMTPETRSAIQTFLSNVTEGFKQLAPAVGPFVKAFSDIAATGSSFWPEIARAISDAAQSFSVFITQARNSGDLKRWMGEGLTTLKQLVDLGWQLARAFMALAPFGKDQLPGLVSAFKVLADAMPTIVKSALLLEPTFIVVAHAIEGWETAIGKVKDAFKAIEPVVTAVGALVERVIDKILAGLDKLLEPIRKAIDAYNAFSPVDIAQIPSLDPADSRGGSAILRPGSGLAGQAGSGLAGQGASSLPRTTTGAPPSPWVPGWVAPGTTPPGTSPPSGVGGAGTTGLLPPTPGPGLPSWGPLPATPGSGIYSPGNTNPALTPSTGAAPSSYVPSGGYPGDAALLAGVPAGRYTQTQGADLTQGLADCSSAVEDLVNIMQGRPTAGRSMSTGNEAQWLTSHGFVPTNQPMPGTFQVGFNSGHTQATLPGGTPFNWGSDSAAANRGIGGSGAWDPGFTQHFYMPVNGVPGGPVSAKTNTPGMPTGQPTDPMYIALSPNIPANQQKGSKGDDSGAGQLGQDFLGGIGEIFGIDGSVFKDPTQFGLFKILKAFMGLKLKDGQGVQGGDGASLLPGSGGGGGGLMDTLTSFIPKPFGDLKVGSPKDAPGQFLPLGPGGSGGSAALPTLPNPFAPPNDPSRVAGPGNSAPVVNNFDMSGSNYGTTPQGVQDHIQQAQLPAIRTYNGPR